MSEYQIEVTLTNKEKKKFIYSTIDNKELTDAALMCRNIRAQGEIMISSTQTGTKEYIYTDQICSIKMTPIST